MTTKVIKFDPGLIPVLKFNPNHDELGRFATSGSPKLTIIGVNDGANDYFNQKTRVVRFQPEGKKPVDYVLYPRDKGTIIAFKKPTNGTSIDGFNDQLQRKAVGYLTADGPGATHIRGSAAHDNKGSVNRVWVSETHQRRGLASAMLRFHRDLYPELDIQHSHALSDEGKAWADVVKFNPNHDPANGQFSTSQGGVRYASPEGSDISLNTLISFHNGALKATDGILSPDAYKSMIDGNINHRYPEKYLDEAVSNPAYQEALQSHLKEIGFPKTVIVRSGSHQGNDFLHGSVASFWRSQEVGYESRVAPSEYRVNRSDIVGIGNVADSGVWFRNPISFRKFNENHDELGRFASAGTGGAGGNGLNHKEIYQLQIGRADELKRAVYRAEEKYQPTEQSTLPRPPYPLRDSYATREEYEKAYKEYSKKFDEYARQSQQNIQSDLGKKYLDGTASGIQRYIGEIAHADWFKQSFGDGGVIGTPKVALSSVKAAGSYRVGLMKGSPFSKMYIDKGLSMNEPVILHEFAHYATAISVTAKYDGHGMEFIGNHLSIVNNVVGSVYASGLAKAYAKEGISLGN